MGLLLLTACVIIVVLYFALGRRRPNTESQDRQETIDPNKLLFSLPTIRDELPPTSQSNLSADALQLQEDDWRQIEFVETSALAEIERELSEIDEFKTRNRVGLGWKNVYVRKESPKGLYSSGLPINLVDSLPHGPIQKLKIGDEVVDGGFAVPLSSSLFLYGRELHGTVVNLGLNRVPNEDESDETKALLSLCKKFSLVILDWPVGRILGAPSG